MTSRTAVRSESTSSASTAARVTPSSPEGSSSSPRSATSSSPRFAPSPSTSPDSVAASSSPSKSSSKSLAQSSLASHLWISVWSSHPTSSAPVFSLHYSAPVTWSDRRVHTAQGMHLSQSRSSQTFAMQQGSLTPLRTMAGPTTYCWSTCSSSRRPSKGTSCCPLSATLCCVGSDWWIGESNDKLYEPVRVC